MFRSVDLEPIRRGEAHPALACYCSRVVKGSLKGIGTMRYHVLACDFDGTLACDGKVSNEATFALHKLLASGRKLILVTGRRLNDLQSLFPHLKLFERVVAENGGVIYVPQTGETNIIAERCSEDFVNALKARGISPIEVGHTIIATWQPHEAAVLETIHDLGLELHVIFNKGAIMVLPSGTNKATGLYAALEQIGFSAHNTVAIGDAENDHALLSLAECAVAVANGVPAIRDRADYVTFGDHGAGVVELADILLDNDLAHLDSRLTRHYILLGEGLQHKVCFSPYQSTILICGPSGSGKSSAAQGIVERLHDAGYQYCLIDPEGDFQDLPGATIIGGHGGVPSVNEIIHVLRHSESSVVINLLALPAHDRPMFFGGTLLPHLQELRTVYGRPHWLVLDEAQYLVPSSWDQSLEFTRDLIRETIVITVHPSHLAKTVLLACDTVIAIGSSPEITFSEYSHAIGMQPPTLHNGFQSDRRSYVWFKKTGIPPAAFRCAPARGPHQRHIRKYAEGDLGAYHSFYFTGPNHRLNLRAQNLQVFMQLADGLDDATWQFHLRRHDYSRWFRGSIRDEALAQVAEGIENSSLCTNSSRAHIRAAIEERYSTPV